MKNKLIIIGFLLVAFWLTGCTITKRVYMDGYHVEWHKNNKNDVRENVSNDENYNSVSKSVSESTLNTFSKRKYLQKAPKRYELVESYNSNKIYASTNDKFIIETEIDNTSLDTLLLKSGIVYVGELISKNKRKIKFLIHVNSRKFLDVIKIKEVKEIKYKKESNNTKKAGANIKLEKSQNNLANDWPTDLLKDFLLMALITIGGILVLLGGIWVFFYYPKTALMVLMILLIIGIIVGLIFALINGDGINIRF